MVDRIRRAIVVTGLEPGDLTVDLPASALMRSPERFRRVAGDLSEIGVAIAIDDVTRVVHPDAFAGIDVDAVKIARSPKRGATPATIGEEATGAVIEVARTLGAASVAKAVETAEERELLERLGCDRAFGHLFLPPLPPRDLAQELWPATPAAPISPSPGETTGSSWTWWSPDGCAVGLGSAELGGASRRGRHRTEDRGAPRPLRGHAAPRPWSRPAR